jgi:hypothetical protein
LRSEKIEESASKGSLIERIAPLLLNFTIFVTMSAIKSGLFHSMLLEGLGEKHRNSPHCTVLLPVKRADVGALAA